MPIRKLSAPARAKGAVLVTVLSVLLALMVVGVAATRLATDDERSARHERDRQLAFHVAEATQQDVMDKVDHLTFAAAVPPDPPLWQRFPLNSALWAHQYGSTTGSVMAAGDGALPARPASLLIEKLPLPAGATPATYYRITTVGFGSRDNTEVVLQSVVRRTSDGKQERVSWREIANWRELHQAAQ